MADKLTQQKTIQGWLNSMRPHNGGCKCHLRAKRFFTIALDELIEENKIDEVEKKRLLDMIQSSDGESQYVGLSLLKNIVPHLFIDKTPIYNGKNQNQERVS